MSRFLKQSHAIWHCTYHIVWTPKYRYRILKGKVKEDLSAMIHSLLGQNSCFLEELNIQNDHVHLIVKIPPKKSISQMMGILKGKTAVRMFNKHKHLKTKLYWGNQFWAKGYCVDTIGLDEEKNRRYVQYQESQEKRNNN